MAKLQVPNKSFAGISHGITFTGGVSEDIKDKELYNRMVDKGYLPYVDSDAKAKEEAKAKKEADAKAKEEAKAKKEADAKAKEEAKAKKEADAKAKEEAKANEGASK